jgi:hypothetical protein
LPGRTVADQPGVPCVDQQQSAYRGWTRRMGWKVFPLPPFPPLPPEESPRERLELARRFGATPCISIPGEIHEVERCGTPARNAVDVCEPRFSGCGARTRETSTDQRVDQARLADVRAPHQGDLCEAFSRKVRRACGAPNEDGFEFQTPDGADGAGRPGGFAHPPYLPDPTYLPT